MAHCLIVARSARALAESARHSGYRVHAIDAFADIDTQAACETVAHCDYTVNGFNLEQLDAQIETLIARHHIDLLVVGAGIEQQPDLFKRFQGKVFCCFNTGPTLQVLCDPVEFAELLSHAQVSHPAVHTRPPPSLSGYLVKQVGGMGGEQVDWADSDSMNGRPHYFQSFIDGETRSVVFLADGRDAAIVGFNRQWQYGQLPSRPFLYGGACSIEPDNEHRRLIQASLEKIVAASGLKGLCGMDYIMDASHTHQVLEVNPRPPATFELHEGTRPLFETHIDAFSKPVRRYERCHQHRACVIIYADNSMQIHRDFAWPAWVKDRPQANKIIHSRQPVCTVHAEAETAADLTTQIEDRQQTLRDRLAELVKPA